MIEKAILIIERDDNFLSAPEYLICLNGVDKIKVKKGSESYLTIDEGEYILQIKAGYFTKSKQIDFSIKSNDDIKFNVSQPFTVIVLLSFVLPYILVGLIIETWNEFNFYISCILIIVLLVTVFFPTPIKIKKVRKNGSVRLGKAKGSVNCE